MLGGGIQREMSGPLLKGISIHTEAEVAGEGNEPRAVPVTIRGSKTLQTAVGAFLYTFAQQG